MVDLERVNHPVAVLLLCSACWVCACTTSDVASCPEFEVADEAPELLKLMPYEVSPQECADALEGTFNIRGETLSLQVPIDWHQDPFDNRSWCMVLHQLEPLKPLLYHYATTGEVEALRPALDIALDWVESNPQVSFQLPEFAWYDLAVAYRAVRMTYLYRALEHEQVGTAAERRRLGCAITEHARWLYDDDHYVARHNHGLYEDAALLMVSRQLGAHPEAPAWRDRALKRFTDNITSCVSASGAMHLEHSPGYHMLITTLLKQLLSELHLTDGRLVELDRQLTATASWLVMPDGTLPTIGDTSFVTAPDWALEQEADHRGFAAFYDAGAAIYRDPLSYFMAVAWYHRPSHKHADELSFVWAEDGRRLVVDTGKYGFHYGEPGYAYSVSSRAHNTLTLFPPFAFEGQAAYGSGILDSATVGDWYAVLGENPLVGGLLFNVSRHRRVFAYRPGRWLVVVDQLDADPCPPSTRWFHFAPALEVVEANADSVHLADVVGSVWLQTPGDTGDLRVVQGQREPEIQGFIFAGSRNFVPNATVELVDEVCGSPLVTVLSVGPTPPATSALSTPEAVDLRLDDEQVSIRFGDDALTVEAY